MDESHWGDGNQAQPYYMGRLPLVGQADADEPEHDNPLRPKDDHQDGCPGAWYRCAFASSLSKYERVLTESGFNSNLMADRCTDSLVLEALSYIELERVRARSFWYELRSSKDS